MVTIRPFRAVRPRPDLVETIASVPYDVLDTREARELSKDNPFSLLRVTRSDLEFDDAHDPYADEVYSRALANFSKFRSEGWLVQEESPAIYIYELEMQGRIQTGIAAVSALADYDHGIIKKHEKTRADKELDRTRHIKTLRAQTGPVFLTYRDNKEIDSLVQAEKNAVPIYNFTAGDGIRHTLWRCENPTRLVELFATLNCTYIADGHHRAASAARNRDECRAKNPQHTGKEDYNFFLTVLFPDTQLKILPYHRAIKKLTKTPEQILSQLGEVYKITENASPTPSSKGEVSLYLQGKWYGLALPPGEAPPVDLIESLETSILHNRALQPIFDIGDPRTDKNIDFVGGIRGTSYLKELVDSGKAGCAFALYPTTIDELIQISDAGLIMAPKSTWFEPKLRDGLLIHVF